MLDLEYLEYFVGVATSVLRNKNIHKDNENPMAMAFDVQWLENNLQKVRDAAK
jgi:hypothetical protein